MDRIRVKFLTSIAHFYSSLLLGELDETADHQHKETILAMLPHGHLTVLEGGACISITCAYMICIRACVGQLCTTVNVYIYYSVI